MSISSMVNKDIVRSVDAIDLVTGSLAKPLVEGMLSPVVGNGSLISGGAKMVVAFASAKYAGSGRLGKAIAIGAGMDGAEDLIIGIRGRLGGNTPASVSAGVF